MSRDSQTWKLPLGSGVIASSSNGLAIRSPKRRMALASNSLPLESLRFCLFLFDPSVYLLAVYLDASGGVYPYPHCTPFYSHDRAGDFFADLDALADSSRQYQHGSLYPS